MTSTETVHVEAPAAAFTPPPPIVKVAVPAAAVTVGAPPQAFTTFGVAAITRPAGSASLKVRLVRAGAPAGFEIVKVSVEVCPTPIVAGAKAFASDGTACTVRLEAVTELVTRAVAVMLAAAFVYGPPTTLEVTSTVTTHEACVAFIVAPVTVTVPLAAAAVTTPAPEGHVLVTFGVAATTTFAGSVSVKLMPVCAGLPAALVMVKVSVDVPFTLIVVGANALLSEACPTVRVWLVTPLVRTPPTVTWAAPFTKAPEAGLTTSTVTVQVELPAAAFTPPPPTVKVPVPAVAVMAGAPPQLFTTFGVAAITTLPGSVSLKVRPVRAGVAAGLVMVKVSVEAWPTPTVDGTNALVSAGRLWTVRQAEDTPPVPMCAVVPMFAAVLVCVAGFATQLLLVVAEVTSTVITHEACAADMEAPVTVMVPLPAAAVTTPVPDGHVVVTFGVAATLIADGSVSVKLMPDCAGLPAPLVIVKVSVDVPFWLMVTGANDLSSEVWVTVRVWLVTPLVSTPPTVTLPAPFV